MNREELTREAVKYAVDYPTSYGKGYKHKDLRIAYLAGAEPREKRIAELEQTNKKISDECHKLVDTLEKKQKEIIELEKENAELKEKIRLQNEQEAKDIRSRFAC